MALLVAEIIRETAAPGGAPMPPPRVTTGRDGARANAERGRTEHKTNGGQDGSAARRDGWEAKPSAPPESASPPAPAQGMSGTGAAVTEAEPEAPAAQGSESEASRLTLQEQ